VTAVYVAGAYFVCCILPMARGGIPYHDHHDVAWEKEGGEEEKGLGEGAGGSMWAGWSLQSGRTDSASISGETKASQASIHS
jgi:hypothetical protein